jgi:DNA (cytosine-5)-methyltransferase 1
VSGNTQPGEPKRKAASVDSAKGVGADDREGIGIDQYNGAITGDQASTLGVNCGMTTGRQAVIALDRAEFNQGKNAQFAFEISDSGIASPLVAKGPSAVCYGTVVLEGNGQRPSHKGDGYAESDTSYTLNATEVHGVAYAQPIAVATQQGGAEINENGICPTLTAAAGMSGNNQPWICQGLDTYNQALTGDKAKCLNSAATDSDHLPCVVYSVENHPADSRVDIDDSGKVQTLTSRMVTGGGNVPMVLQCYSKSKRAQSDTDFETWKESDTANTINTFDLGDVRATDIVVYKPRYVVRRLTPLECERLQGFPDGWTDIGEWVDSNGKTRKTSDAARYKALGNSIALPPWKWVLKRLCACYERDATMASLFDGIGGFPYLWEQLNGKGSCLWASEIEEFPIAVTKKRFGD